MKPNENNPASLETELESNGSPEAAPLADGETGLSEEALESSTIFSKPQIIDKRKPRRSRHLPLKMAAAILAVTVLVGAIFVLGKYLPKSGDNAASSLTSSAGEVPSVKMINHTLAEVGAVTLKNEYQTFKFHPIDDETVDTGRNWHIKGMEDKYLDFANTSRTVEDCATLEALFVLDEAENTDYGFSEPSAIADVKLLSGEKYTITVGAPFARGEIKGAYAKLSTAPGKVYVLDEYVSEYLCQGPKQYINVEAYTKIEKTKKNAEYFEGDNLKYFDYIELSGPAVAENYRFECYGRENSEIIYQMTAPEKLLVSGGAISEGENAANKAAFNLLFDILEANIQTYYNGVYEYENGGLCEKTLKKYGLDNPAATMKYKVAGRTVEIILSQSPVEEDADFYAMTLEGCPVIYKVSKNFFTFFERRPYEFASTEIVRESIVGLSKVEYTIGGKSYRFDISSKKDDGSDVSVKYDGKTIEFKNFSTYYGAVLNISPITSQDGIRFSRHKGAKFFIKVVLTPKKSVGDPPLTLEIFKLADTDTRYYVELDSTPVGLCATTFCDFMVDKIDEIISNKSIN